MKKIYFISFYILFICACSTTQIYNQGTHTKPTNNMHAKLLYIAKEWRKTPYVLGGTTKAGADCSAFTQDALKELGISIPRTTTNQLFSGQKISKNALKTGDLVFFKTGRGPNGMHVGIYTSNDSFIHLSSKGGVKEASLNNSYWKARYIGARRYK